MVRFAKVVFAGALLAPLPAWADLSDSDELHPGLAELLGGIEVPFAEPEDEQPLVLDLDLERDLHESQDFVAYREERGARCPGCAEGQVTPTNFYDPTFLRRLGYRWLDKTRVGLAFNAGPFSYGFWGDVREIYNLSAEDSGLVPTLSSVSANQIDVVASELVIRQPVQDAPTSSPSVVEPEPVVASIDSTITPTSGPSLSPVSNAASSVSLAGSSAVLTNSSASLSRNVATVSADRVSDISVVDRVSVPSRPSLSLNRPDPLGATRVASSVPVVSPATSSAPATTTPNVVAQAPGPSVGPAATPEFAPSDNLGRTQSGADSSYTEYIGGFFIAAPF